MTTLLHARSETFSDCFAGIGKISVGRKSVLDRVEGGEGRGKCGIS